MSKREIATLVDALRLNTRILNEKLREQELIFNSLLELQETIDGQLSTLEEELEKCNLLDEDEYIELDDESKRELRVGDYVSEPIENFYGDIGLTGDYVLYQIVKVGDKYTKMILEKHLVDEDFYDNIKDLEREMNDDACVYYVEDDFKFGVGRYLVYGLGCGGDFEILVKYENDKIRIFTGGADDYFIDEEFDTMEEVESYLRKEYELVKKLRYSVQW